MEGEYTRGLRHNALGANDLRSKSLTEERHVVFFSFGTELEAAGLFPG